MRQVKNVGKKPIPVGGVYLYPGESVLVTEQAFNEAKQANPEAIVSGGDEVTDGGNAGEFGKPTGKRRTGTRRRAK